MFRQTKSQEVIDHQLGSLLFPLGDKVMAPFINEHGIWESDEVDWLKQNIKEGLTCLNIGANVGYFACWMSILTGKRGKVIAIEPNPELLPFLKKNISNLELKNIDVMRFAAGEKTTKTRLYLNRNNYGDSRVFDPRTTIGGGDYIVAGFTPKLESKKIKMISLDEFIDEKIDLVLCDTQGWDHFALRGMKKLIKRFHPSILTEFSPPWIEDLGENPIDVISEFQSWGYRIGSTDLDLSENPSAKEINAKIQESEKFYANLILN